MTQRYDTYKDSGVQWLGEIPGHWERNKVLRLFKQIGSGTTPSSGDASLYADEGTPWLQSGDFNNNEINSTSKYVTDKALDNYGLRLYKPGGVVIAMYGASIGKVGLLNIATTVNQACCVLSDSDHLLQKFSFYVFINEKDNLVKKSKGGTQPNISQEIIKSHYIPIPPLSEQRSIVSFLDAKCGKIDEWVTKKQKEVEHLQELKQRVIADAVTRGLNPHVKMKTTNIPWLKEIPEHWERTTLRKFLRLFSVKNHGDKQLLSVTREQGVIVRDIESKEGNHNFIPDDLSGYKYVQIGDFVINKMKSWQGSYGVSDYEGIVSPAYYTCKLEGIDKTFFSLAIRSKIYVSFFGRYSKGIRVDQWDLSPFALKSIPFAVPPLSEQKQIVSYLDAKTSKIDKLIANITKEIECIKEYKQRLISDVVIGQIKVC